MKIVYIIGGIYSANGMSDVMTRKVNWLARHTDYELHVVLTERPDLKPFYQLDERVQVVNLNIGFDRLDTLPLARKVLLYRRLMMQYRRQLTAYLLECRADVVVSALRRDINFLCDVPDGSRKVGELHFARSSYRVFCKPWLPQCANRWITHRWQRGLIRQLKQLSAFVVLSHEDAQCWPELSNIHVIPNSIRQIPDHVAQPSSKRVIAAGRYTYQKGFDLLLQAWQPIETTNSDWHLYVYGSGDSTPYRQQADEMQLQHVHLMPTVPDLQAEMLRGSVFAFSSRYEGFGLVLAEAMSCGLVPVSFACPCGPRDIITDGVDGVLVPAADVVAFTDALRRVMSDEALRSTMAVKARQSSVRYEEDAVMQLWLEIFAESLP